MPTIFVDETGYTGPDLLNSAQSVFVLASHDFEEQEAREIKRQFFGRVRATELKYSQLRSRPRQQDMILRFLESFDAKNARFKFVYAHKEFCVVAKMVDLIIEPWMCEHGIDLYDQGENIALSNLIYFTTSSLAGSEYFRRLLEAFQDFFRMPSQDSFRTAKSILESRIDLCETSTNEPDLLRGVLRFLHLSTQNMKGEYIDSLSSNDLDICFTFALRLMDGWAKRHGEEMLLVHDASSEMSKRKALWSKIVSPDVSPTKVGWDRRTMKFPIRIKETKFGSSTEWAGLQLADILAGSIGECLRSGIEQASRRTKYVQRLCATVSDWSCHDHIWPNFDFTPAELKTEGAFKNDPIEHMMKLIRRN